MDIKEIIENRHSVRNYSPDVIPENILFEVLNAGRLAPSAQNRQPWRFVVINNNAMIKKMVMHCGLIGLANFFIKDAPCVIIACADSKQNVRINNQDYYLVDTAIAFHQMILTAWSFGIGTCWLAAFSEKTLKKWLELPKSWRIVAMSPFGYPAEKKGVYGSIVSSLAGSHDRLGLDEIVVYK